MSTAKKIERANARTQSLQAELLDTQNDTRLSNNGAFILRKKKNKRERSDLYKDIDKATQGNVVDFYKI